MKTPKFLQKSSEILLLGMLISAFGCLNLPSVYSDDSNQETTEQTPQEQEQETPSNPENRIDIYRKVQQEVCEMSEEPEDINLTILLGSDESQFRFNFEAVGYVDSSGKPHSITARDICEMIQTAINNDGSFDTSYFEQGKILIAGASSSFLQAQRVSIIDLIVRNQGNGKYYLLPNVRVDFFCREAVNAFLNSTWSKNDIDLRNLRIRNIEE